MFLQSKKYFYLHRYEIAILLGTSVLSAIIGTFFPYLTGMIITRISRRDSLMLVLKNCGCLLALYIILQGVGFVTGLIRMKTEVCMGKEFNSDVIFHVQELPWLYIQKQNITVLNQSINQDTNTVIIFCLDTLLNVTTQVASFILLVVLCCHISVYMTGIIAISAVVYIAIYTFMKDRIYDARTFFRKQESAFFSKLFEQLAYIYFIKTNSIEDKFRKRLSVSFEEYLKSRMRDGFVQSFLSFSQGLATSIFQIVMLFLGANEVYNGNLEIGFLLTFSSYFSQLQSTIRYFLSLGASYQNAKVAKKRIDSVMNQMVEKTEGIKLKETVNNICCRELSFGFNGHTGDLYGNISFTMERGKIYCLVGANGKGKTTFVNILLGLYRDKLPSNTLFINGKDINKLDSKWLRKEKISYLSQESVIFPDEYSSNVEILAKDLGASKRHKLEYLSKLLNAKSLSPETSISIDMLSGGEARKVCLIRTLIKSSEILILDEPDSSLDEESTEMLMRELKRDKESRITIIISHNQKIMNQADKVVDL